MIYIGIMMFNTKGNQYTTIKSKKYWSVVTTHSILKLGSCLYVGFIGFDDGLSCFPLNEKPIYVEKHIFQLAKAFTMKMTSCIDQWHAQFGP